MRNDRIKWKYNNKYNFIVQANTKPIIRLKMCSLRAWDIIITDKIWVRSYSSNPNDRFYPKKHNP